MKLLVRMFYIGLMSFAVNDAHAIGGGLVKSGQVILERDFISQQSDRAVIDWQDFNLESSEKLTIAQPTADSILLNRVVSGVSTKIAGEITANGRVVISNSQGVIFANGAEIRASDIFVTTAGISDSDFMKDDSDHTSFLATGTDTQELIGIENSGSIVANRVAGLISPKVVNNGRIEAHTVHIKNNDSFVLYLGGNNLFGFNINDNIKTILENYGTIETDNDGSIFLGIDESFTIVESLIHIEGYVRVPVIEAEDSKIVIKAPTPEYEKTIIEQDGIEKYVTANPCMLGLFFEKIIDQDGAEKYLFYSIDENNNVIANHYTHQDDIEKYGIVSPYMPDFFYENIDLYTKSYNLNVDENGNVVDNYYAAGSYEDSEPYTKLYQVNIDGVVDADGHDGCRGGMIEITGEHISLMPNAYIHANGNGAPMPSGAELYRGSAFLDGETKAASEDEFMQQPYRGGGSIRIGGDIKDANVSRASFVNSDIEARVEADADYTGDGGRIVIFGNQEIILAGRLSARGGSNAGRGGFIETSSHLLDFGLDSEGRELLLTDVSAATGYASGLRLTDPSVIMVKSLQDSDMNNYYAENGQVCTARGHKDKAAHQIYKLPAEVLVEHLENGDLCLEASSLNFKLDSNLILPEGSNLHLDSDRITITGGHIIAGVSDEGIGGAIDIKCRTGGIYTKKGGGVEADTVLLDIARVPLASQTICPVQIVAKDLTLDTPGGEFVIDNKYEDDLGDFVFKLKNNPRDFDIKMTEIDEIIDKDISQSFKSYDFDVRNAAFELDVDKSFSGNCNISSDREVIVVDPIASTGHLFVSADKFITQLAQPIAAAEGYTVHINNIEGNSWGGLEFDRLFLGSQDYEKGTDRVIMVAELPKGLPDARFIVYNDKNEYLNSNIRFKILESGDDFAQNKSSVLAPTDFDNVFCMIKTHFWDKSLSKDTQIGSYQRVKN